MDLEMGRNSTTDSLHLINHVAEKLAEYNRLTRLAFLDYDEAFDC